MGKTVRYYKSTKAKMLSVFGEEMSLNKLLGIITVNKLLPNEYAPKREKCECLTTTIDDQWLTVLSEIKNTYRTKFGKSITFADIIDTLLDRFSQNTYDSFITVNVKGYRTKPTELRHRLKKIANVMSAINPAMIFLQEFVVGEDNCILSAFLRELREKYHVILPLGFNPDENYDFCICMTLIRDDHFSEVKYGKIETPISEVGDYKLRYNLFTMENRGFMNVWIPQTYNASEGRIFLAEQMWEQILKVVRLYWNSSDEFFLAGDFNSYVKDGHGTFEEQIQDVERMLVNTKSPAIYFQNTCTANNLDQVYANRAAVQNKPISTTFMLPSFISSGLSDHEALITRVKMH